MAGLSIVGTGPLKTHSTNSFPRYRRAVFGNGLQGHLPQSQKGPLPQLMRVKDIFHDRRGISRGRIIFLPSHLTGFLEAVPFQEGFKPVPEKRAIRIRKTGFEH